jgi:TonB family protein
MKKIICLSILLCMGFTAAHSETKKISQLPVQQSVALSPHLTTRISWIEFPQPQYDSADLKSRDRAAVIRVEADETGKVTKASVQESTGLTHLDDILLSAVRNAKVKPYIEDETPVAIIGYQTFNLRLSHNDQESCDFTFQSENWIKQNSDKKTAFQYKIQPHIEISTNDLKGHDRTINFSLKVDKHGNVNKVDIRKGSGLYELDQSLVQAIMHTPLAVKRSASTLWIYKKSKFKDSIQFKLDECQ